MDGYQGRKMQISKHVFQKAIVFISPIDSDWMISGSSPAVVRPI